MSRRSYIQDMSYYIMNMPFVFQGQGRFEYTSVNVTFYVDIYLTIETSIFNAVHNAAICIHVFSYLII